MRDNVITLSDGDLEKILVRRIDDAGRSHTTYVANPADPTVVEKNECRVAAPTTDTDGELDVETWSVEYVASLGTEFRVTLVTGTNGPVPPVMRESNKALYDYQDKCFIENAAWSSGIAIAVLIGLLKEGIWYDKRDREPSVEEIFS